jgi:hypothetical protein
VRPVVQDTFEDAVDNASVRSLTKRKPSLNRQTTNSPPNSPPLPDIVDDEALPDAVPDAKPDSPERKKSLRISQTSVTGLDEVNLGDDQATPSPVPGTYIVEAGSLLRWKS